MAVDLDQMSIDDMIKVLRAIENGVSVNGKIDDEDYEEVRDRVFDLIKILKQLNK
jgi:uncharacterized protein YfkK (UPF0435 family)